MIDGPVSELFRNTGRPQLTTLFDFPKYEKNTSDSQASFMLGFYFLGKTFYSHKKTQWCARQSLLIFLFDPPPPPPQDNCDITRTPIYKGEEVGEAGKDEDSCGGLVAIAKAG